MKHLALLILLSMSVSGVCQPQSTAKPRTIVTTDGEIDDVDSFIRMLLYANEFTLEGLVYSSSMWHYKGDGKGTLVVSEMDMTRQLYGKKSSLRWPGTTWMNDLLDAYASVYPTLSTHARGYPTAAHLKSMVRVGNIDFEGEMASDTEGSDFIKSKLLDNTTSPIYLQVWGGTNTIARALKSIEDQYKHTPNWAKVYKKVASKAIIYAILDQDATYRNYIAVNWKDIRVYYNAKQFWCLAYNWQKAVPEQLHPWLEGKFMGDNIINKHGALTKLYYSYGDNRKQPGDEEHIHGNPAKLTKAQWGSFHPYDFISEGDSPAFLQLIDVGLGSLNQPHYGGWGGRLTQSSSNPNRWEDGQDVVDFNPYTQQLDMAYPQIRWLEALQLDFAARADWCIKPYQEANHPPKISVKATQVLVHAGQRVTLTASATDPDKNQVALSFWQYQEIGTLPEKVAITTTGNQAMVQIPATAKRGDTLHVIVEGKDTGIPALTRYRRVILTVR